MYMEEAPLGWFRWVLRLRGYHLSLPEFERGLLSLYGKNVVVGYPGDLSKLKQEGFACDEYQKEFMRLFHQVNGLSEEFLISCFMSSLQENVGLGLLAKRPQSMLEAMRLAKIEKEKSKRYQRNTY